MRCALDVYRVDEWRLAYPKLKARVPKWQPSICRALRRSISCHPPFTYPCWDSGRAPWKLPRLQSMLFTYSVSPPSICFPLAAPCNHCAKNSISKNNGRQKIVKPFASVLACAMHIIVREYNIRVTETMLSECMAGSHFVTPGLWQGGGPTRSHMPGFFFSFFSFARFYVFHCVHWLLVARLRIDVGRAQITSLPFIALTHLSSPSQMTHL